MKHILFIILAVCLTFGACSSAKKPKTPPIKEGITGTVRLATGNRMPMKDMEPALPKGMAATVLIYEPTHISQVTRVGTSPLYTAIHTKMIASVETDSTGSYKVALPPGTYSLFIKQGKNFFSNLFDVNNNICPFTVTAGKLTTANLTVNSNASY